MKIKRIATLLCLSCVISAVAPAAEMAGIFSSNMVLQKGAAVPVFGLGQPGEKVVVTFDGQKKSTEVAEDGRWQVELNLNKYGGPFELKMESPSGTKSLPGVLVGEVWLCAGQSNIASPLGKMPLVETANWSQIRVARIFENQTSDGQVPARDVKRADWGKVESSNPILKDYSAVGVTFAVALYRALGEKVPVGIIQNARGGIPVASYMSMESLRNTPDFAGILEKAEENKRNNVKEQVWNEPAWIYNNLHAPLAPFKLAGFVWYQGETDAGNSDRYRKTLPVMVDTWRKLWKAPTLPFLIVQLAAPNGQPETGEPEPARSRWGYMREAQEVLSREIPHSGLVVTYDLPKPTDDVHYGNKAPVGERLANVAMAGVYGKSVPAAGPTILNADFRGDKVEINFSNTGRALQLKDGGTTPEGFVIAGEDRKFYRAEARLAGSDKVEVWSSQVARPVAVRYAWSNSPNGANLFNSENLPALPFRTDDWPMETTPK